MRYIIYVFIIFYSVLFIGAAFAAPSSALSKAQAAFEEFDSPSKSPSSSSPSKSKASSAFNEMEEMDKYEDMCPHAYQVDYVNGEEVLTVCY